MNHKKINKLERKTFEDFGDRKREGRIDLVGCISNSHVTFYGVPKNIEHSEFIPKIKERYDNIIPVQLRFNKDYTGLEELIFGVSSYETENKITHDKKDIKKIVSATIKLVQKSRFYSLGKIRILDYKKQLIN